MNRSLRRSLFLAGCMAVVGLGSDCAGAEPLPGRAVEDFEWFSTLGFPDVRGLTFVRVGTGSTVQAGSKPPEERFTCGFLVRHDDDAGTFTVLTPRGALDDFPRRMPGMPEPPRTSYQATPLATVADDFLAELDNPSNEGSNDLFRRYGEFPSFRIPVFFWAWACWRSGLDERAGRLYRYAAAIEPDSGEEDDHPLSLRERLELHLSAEMLGRATVDLANPEIPRARLLEPFERIARNFRWTKSGTRAGEMADRLRAMIAGDAAHATKPAVPLDDLQPGEQIAELIFRLRDQKGYQISEPGYCNIFGDWGPREPIPDAKKTPAHRLVDLGYAAVPQLIAALGDQDFSRSMGGMRLGSGGCVLTVGDCAEQILERIAGREFYRAASTSSYMSKDGETYEVKRQVEAWWREFQQKGEKQTLIDAVTKGNATGERQAGLLVGRYPDAALAPLIRGAQNASDGGLRARFVKWIGRTPGDGSVPFLEEELRQDPTLESRLAAARALWQHERATEATEAMIGEWGKRPPPLHAPAPKDDASSGRDPDDAEVEGRAGLIRFLAGCRRVDAIEALGRDLHRWPVATRLDVITQFTPPYPRMAIETAFAEDGTGNLEGDRALLRRWGDDETKVSAAAEAFLVAELDDREQALGLCGMRPILNSYDPRVCDLAGSVLAARFEEKYTFVLDASLKERESQRIACLNVWRVEHGEPPLPPAAERRIEPAPESVVLPLLRTLAGPSDGGDRAEAEAAVTKLGLSALAPLRAFKAALPIDHPRRARLEALERQLACTVAAVELANPPVDNDEWRRTMQKRLDTLKGVGLTSEAFVALASDIADDLPEEAAGFTLEGARDEDFGGVRIILKLLAPRPRSDYDPHPGRTEFVSSGREALHGLSGGGGLAHMRKEADHEGFQRAADRALEAAADQPFSLLLSTSGRE